MTTEARGPRFARPDDAAAFFGAYDRLAARWPAATDALDLHSAYGTTHVRVCGPQDGPAVVLLHGGGATSTVWHSTVAHLDGYRVFAPDLIGDAGRSVNDGRRLRSPADFMTYLDGLLDQLGLDTARLCGHSYGGWLALSYALHMPKRVGRLALLDPTMCFGGMSLTYRLRAVPLFAAPSPDRLRAFFRWETAGRHLDPDWLDVAALGAAARWSKVVMPRRPSPEQLRSLEVPMLVVLAARSRSHDAAKAGATAVELVPHTRTVTLRDASHHTVPTEHAAAIGAELHQFF